jgi:hypothetical protein
MEYSSTRVQFQAPPGFSHIEACCASHHLRRTSAVASSMPSTAFSRWTSSRSSRLDQLTAAHAIVGGRGPGRRTQTQSINWSLVLLLASEFQGYVRELHDEAAEFLASAMSNGNQTYIRLIRNNLTINRALDHKNARSETLREDFRRFGGFDLCADISASLTSGPRWIEKIDILNEARNSIAHNNLGKLQMLSSKGYPLNLPTVKSWGAACRGVARHADIVVGRRLTQITGVKPW